jgi:hypothetical protein
MEPEGTYTCVAGIRELSFRHIGCGFDERDVLQVRLASPGLYLSVDADMLGLANARPGESVTLQVSILKKTVPND